MKEKQKFDKLCGSTLNSNELQFYLTKRCKDGRKRKITVTGRVEDFENCNLLFLVNVKEEKSNFLNVVLLIAEFLLLLYFRKFVVGYYCFILLIKSLIAIVYISDYSLKQMHGAEHMVVNAYESEKSKIKNIDMAKKYPIMSYNCGTIYFAIEIVSLIIIILTKLPLPLKIVSCILFNIKSVKMFFSFIEKLLIEKPNDKQLYLASITFNLVIDILDKDLEDEAKIKNFVKEYGKVYSRLEKFESSENFLI